MLMISSGGIDPDNLPSTTPLESTKTENGKNVRPNALPTALVRLSTSVGMFHSSRSSHSDGGQLSRLAVALVETV